MRAGTFMIPALLAAACLTAGWQLARQAEAPVSEAAAQVDAAMAVPREAPELPPEPKFYMPDVRAFSATRERPVFSQTRRPIDLEPKVAEKPAPKLALDLELRGIAHSAQDRVAVVSPKRTRELLHLVEGATYQGWTLTTITPKTVTFERDAARRELKLDFEGDARGQRRIRTSYSANRKRN